MEKVGVMLEEDAVLCGDAIHLSAQWLQVYAGGQSDGGGCFSCGRREGRT